MLLIHFEFVNDLKSLDNSNVEVGIIPNIENTRIYEGLLTFSLVTTCGAYVRF